MKIKDVIKNISKEKSNEDWVDIPEFAWNNFDLNVDYDCIMETKQDRLKCYWLYKWYCTDTYVGCKVYFLDSEAVAISTQRGRKYDEEIEWLSEESALKVRDYLISFTLKESTTFNICDLEKDIGDSFKLYFNNEVFIGQEALLEGKGVVIVKCIKEDVNYGLDKKVKVRLLNGEEKIVEVQDLDFKFNLKY